MPAILLLDQNTINQIAAGEVIERPASIVKELCENAIDAGATAITVEIRDGGLSLIRVTDNGTGIPAEEVPLAFLRHSTSKLRRPEDLMDIHTLGFRGEALASIAAVCQVELLTKTADAISGICYEIAGGEVLGTKEMGLPDGTTFVARNIFFNTPARRNFLKTAQTEGNYIADWLEKLALSHPQLSFRLLMNGQTRLFTKGSDSTKDLIYTIFGREISSQILPVRGDTPYFQVEGYIGKPVIARANRSYENYFINGRYVKSKLITAAIEEAYKPYMMLHRYPFTVLHLQISPDRIDVNVHPTKMDLRFKEEAFLYRQLVSVLMETLAGGEHIPPVQLSSEKPPTPPARVPQKEHVEPFEKRRMDGEALRILHQMGSQPVQNSERLPSEPGGTPSLPPDTERIPPQVPESSDMPMVLRESSPPSQKDLPSGGEQLSLWDDKLLGEKARKSHRYIGQLFDTYCLLEYQDSLYICDQHAAHEKVLYERTLKAFEERTVESQYISPPVIVTLSDSEKAALHHYMDVFSRFGFEIEDFGQKDVCVRAVPSNLFGVQDKDVFLELLDSVADMREGSAPDTVLHRIATLSCKAAVKGNHSLTEQEMMALIDELMTLDNPYACPHGRPTIIQMSKYELEKKFKRIV